MAKNKKWSATAKFEIVLQVLKCESTLNEICKRYQVAPSQVHLWKKQFLEQGKEVFSKPSDKPAALKLEALGKKQTMLYETIGQLTVERDFLKKKLGKVPRERRRTLIDEEARRLSLRKQCELLGINRSTLYYKESWPLQDDIDLLNAIRDVWMRYPFYGYRRITKELQAGGLRVNRKRVQRLMVAGSIQALYPGPNTSKRNRQHKVYPYLLRDIAITQSNQAWMVDITYLRMPKGFMYLVALIDVHSRYVVGWSLSNTLETSSCIEALSSALKTAKAEIINSDQGCQFTSEDWIKQLKNAGIKISMTGKGRCLDNVYIERFWRSFKQEEFYLNEYASVKDLRKAIDAYIEFYNHKRWHQSLGYKTPAQVYVGAAEKKEPVDMCTSPSGQPAPFGAYGQAMDNASALPTT